MVISSTVACLAASRSRLRWLGASDIAHALSQGKQKQMPSREGPTDKAIVTPKRRPDGSIEHLNITIPSSYNWIAAATIDPNCFADRRVHDFVNSCTDQLALLHYASELVAEEVAADPETLINSLRLGDYDNIRAFPHTVVFRNMAFYAGLMSTLVAMKNGLDVYAKIISATICPDKKPLDGFNRTQVDGKDLRGGFVLKWLAKQSPVDRYKPLYDLIEAHIKEWIDQAVAYRDTAVHFGRIPGTKGATLVMSKPVALLTVQDVVPAKLPNGQPVDHYCAYVYERFKAFIAETAVHLPGFSRS